MEKKLKSTDGIGNGINESNNINTDLNKGSENKGLQVASSLKTQVDQILSNEKELDEIVDKILSGEYRFCSRGEKGRYIEDMFGYYIYTFILDKDGEKKDVDIIFYSRINSKIIIRIENSFYEILISQNPQILDIISEFYPLPVYNKNPYGGVYLSSTN